LIFDPARQQLPDNRYPTWIPEHYFHPDIGELTELEKHMKKQERDAHFYVDRMNPFIRTPLQRLRNVGVVINRAVRDLLNGRTSHETVVEVIRKAKEFDDLADKRGVAEPLSALAGESSRVGRGRKSKRHDYH
jgi:hypothetical protein